MKAWKIGICTFVIALCLSASAGLVTAAASAHSHPGPSNPAPATSSWAAEEVKRAMDLKLLDEVYSLPDDFRGPITRLQFMEVAVGFMVVQERNRSLESLALKYLAERDPQGIQLNGDSYKPVFTDCPEATAAYYLGLVQGRGDGIFDPEGLITREEAAVMLARAYEAIGGRLHGATMEGAFTDQAAIASWAQESVAALNGWSIMKGMEDGSFSPRGTYSVEQCLLTFLRLYEKAPVSRINGNVTQHFTYEQCLDLALMESDGDFFDLVVTDRVEGPLATVIRSGIGGAPHWLPDTCIVYRDGGIANLDLGVCVLGFSFYSPEMENPVFSQDGKTFTCTVTLERDQVYSWVDPPVLWHPKGIYHITVDVETLDYHYEYEALPAA